MRGSGSSLYGSDAIGGVISFNTRKPTSFVSTDDPLYLSYKTGYSSKNNGFTNTGYLGIGGERFNTLIAYTNRSSDETKTAGSSGFSGQLRQEADPASIRLENLSLRTDFEIGKAQIVSLSFEDYQNQAEFNVLSQVGNVVRGTVINGLTGDDVKDRKLISLEYRLDNPDSPLINGLLMKLYTQDAETNQKASRSEIGRAEHVQA